MNQMTLFSNPQEKGRSEWSLFNAVRHDQPGMFRVKMPIKPQPRYSNVVPIKRFNPQPLSLKSAH